MWEVEKEFVLDKGNRQIIFSDGYGFDVPGLWEVGTYTVRIFFEDYYLAQGFFKIDPPKGPATPTPTPVPDSSGVVVVDTVTIFFGPGPEYGQLGTLEYGELFEITGAYEGCEWFQIIIPSNEVGAIWSGYIEYTLECEQVAQVEPPPAPTEFPPIEPPYIPPFDSIYVKVVNNTEGPLYIELFGVITHPFYYPPGEHELLVPIGTYAYYGYSCGTSESGEFLLENNDQCDNGNRKEFC
jgi:hypothetical protein